MFKEERVVAEGTVFFSIYDGDDPEKKPILKLSSKKTAKVITALLNADKSRDVDFRWRVWTLLRDFIVVRPVKVRT